MWLRVPGRGLGEHRRLRGLWEEGCRWEAWPQPREHGPGLCHPAASALPSLCQEPLLICWLGSYSSSRAPPKCPLQDRKFQDMAGHPVVGFLRCWGCRDDTAWTVILHLPLPSSPSPKLLGDPALSSSPAPHHGAWPRGNTFSIFYWLNERQSISRLEPPPLVFTIHKADLPFLLFSGVCFNCPRSM